MGARMQFSTIPKRHVYPAVGLILALGAPGGLLLLRALAMDGPAGWAWAAGELSSRALTYNYVVTSTAIVFVGLGRLIGKHEDEMLRLSLTDALTGLPNRRHFERRLREELARAVRCGQSLVLMLLDLDGLKKVNDTAGHDSGDEALRAVARTLKHTCRATDRASRTGGDEFAVLAPNVTEREAETLAGRIREGLTVEAREVGGSFPPLTVSIGVADTRHIREPRPDQLYAAADQALYQAKQAGKNRVVLSQFAAQNEGDRSGVPEKT